MMERKPSEVFLELWQWRALDLTPEQFTECAEAWRQIVSLEEREAERKDAAEAFFKNFPTSPIMPAPTTPGPVTCTVEDTSSGAETPPSPPGEGITYDCASAPMPEPAAAAAAVSKSDAAKAGMVTRKRRALEKAMTKLEEAATNGGETA